MKGANIWARLERRNLMKNWIIRWGPAVAIMSFIFVASSIPGSDLPKLDFGDTVLKKGGHMVGYALLAASYLHALNGIQSIKKVRLAAALCLTILYGALDEWHQGFTQGRNPSFMDVFIDATGGMIGLFVWRIIEKAAKSKTPRINTDS
jgi:VanZ family protein